MGFGITNQPPPEQECPLFAGQPLVAQNFGENGATTADWMVLGGGKPLSDALIFITRQGTQQVSIMLGTNDSKPENLVDAPTYQSNLQSIISTLVTNGVTKVVLNQPPYIQPSGTGIVDPTASNALLVQYQTSLANLVTANPDIVFLGDITAYNVFEANPSYYQADGIHPNNIGATVLAQLWKAGYPI